MILLTSHMRHSYSKVEISLVAPKHPMPKNAVFKLTWVPSAIESTTPFKNQGDAIAKPLDAIMSAIELMKRRLVYWSEINVISFLRISDFFAAFAALSCDYLSSFFFYCSF